MNAARLEEIARIAEAITTDGYDPSLNADIRDLARCARGWAKVDAILRAEDGWSVDLWRMSKGHIRMLTNKQSVDGPTALEAVEAAEVKP